MPQRPVILLVEDSEDDAFFFRHALKKTGAPCTLVHVADGGAARRHLEAMLTAQGDPLFPAPDFIFLDLKVPTFTGFEILAWIREQKLEGRFEVIVLSGSEHASDIARSKTLGAAAYCVKPVSVEQLRDHLAPWLSGTASGPPVSPPLQPSSAPV